MLKNILLEISRYPGKKMFSNVDNIVITQKLEFFYGSYKHYQHTNKQ
jgi:hypothetical protein